MVETVGVKWCVFKIVSVYFCCCCISVKALYAANRLKVLFLSSVKISMCFFSVCSLCACVAHNLIKAFSALDEI